MGLSPTNWNNFWWLILAAPSFCYRKRYLNQFPTDIFERLMQFKLEIWGDESRNCHWPSKYLLFGHMVMVKITALILYSMENRQKTSLFCVGKKTECFFYFIYVVITAFSSVPKIHKKLDLYFFILISWLFESAKTI